MSPSEKLDSADFETEKTVEDFLSEFQVLLDDLDQAIAEFKNDRSNNSHSISSAINNLNKELRGNDFCKQAKKISTITDMIFTLDKISGSYNEEDYAEFLKLCEEFKTQIAM